MSRAGVFSNRGDFYQILIATHWLISLLREPEKIDAIQAESIGLPGESSHISVDDIVVCYKDGHKRYIQAKKNQPDFRPWSFADLKDELLKAFNQLEHCPNADVEFYSRSTFGDIQKLAEECTLYHDYFTFVQEAPNNQKSLLQQLSKVIGQSEEASFNLACRLHFGPTDDFERWEGRNRADLAQLVPCADNALSLLESLLLRHQSKLADTKVVITREDVLAVLAGAGLAPTPFRMEADILESFKQSSAIGRQWPRTIAGRIIPTPHVETILSHIKEDKRTILVQGGPGSGKTCVLLDVADAIESRADWGMLFIKADMFREIETLAALTAAGMPDDIVGQCARLSEYRRVVVVIDSLDVLSLSRHHRALRLFLGLIDRLQRLVGVTTIVACRMFDLKYDPLLRDRIWEQIVLLNDLDFESQVAPLFHSLGIDPATLPAKQRRLLCVPHLLQLFATLVERGSSVLATAPYELFECFLNELVLKNPLLGPTAIVALQKMAEDQLSERAGSIPQARFAHPQAISHLLSLGILIERTPGGLQFGHQTWGEVLSVRMALANGQTLGKFIHAHPALPFIRPIVRAFLFYLRTHQPTTFSRQVRVVLADSAVAYHLKRLIAESLAELVPCDDDWGLVRHLSDAHQDLFHRFIWRTQSPEWFNYLRERWLPHILQRQSNEHLLRQFMTRQRIWMNSHPAEVVALWRHALADCWVDKQYIRYELSFVLNEFKHWSVDGVGELLGALLKIPIETDHDFLGKPLSRFVEATNAGDDMLWAWITRNIGVDDIASWDLGQKLECQPHDFYSQQFLAERMAKSEALLATGLTAISGWSQKIAAQYGERALVNNFLSQTSWDRRHSDHDTSHVDAMKMLFDAIEKALRIHAAHDSPWWRQHSADLQSSPELARRYLHLVACRENIAANVGTINIILQDTLLFRDRQLCYELGKIMNAAYPYLTQAVWEANQDMLLNLYRNAIEEDERDWAVNATFTLLSWIPACCRTLDAQAFLDQHAYLSPAHVRESYVYSWGGSVSAPFSAETLLSLTDDGILKLLSHYIVESCRADYEHRNLIGGKADVLNVLRNAASLDPVRLLGLISRIRYEISDSAFVEHVLEGLTNHLSHRTGRLQAAQDWRPVSSPEPLELAKAILALLERWPALWRGKRETTEAIRACTHIFLEPEDTERLLFSLLGCLRAADPTEEAIEKNSDLIFLAINSTRGKAAEAVFDLCNRLLEAEQPLPELLPPLLHRLARDSSPSIRDLVLLHLPYTLHKAPDLGWSLLEEVFETPDTRLWPHAERCLYYQYRDNYERVEPWLARWESEGMKTAGDSWGRLASLVCLAGNIPLAPLLQKVQKSDSIKALQGAVQVFAANLNSRDSYQLCHEGLLAILRSFPQAREIIDAVEHVFSNESNHPYISMELAKAYLHILTDTNGRCDLREFLQWLAYAARENPMDALEAAEAMLDMIENRKEPCQIWSTKDLLAALTAIMREADESDEPDLIHRAIYLQDQLLKLDVRGMEELFEAAGAE